MSGGTFSTGATTGFSETPGTLDLNGSGTSGQIFFGNSAAGLTGAQLAKINFSGYASGAMILSTGEITAVPEPSTWALLAFSLTALVVTRRRRNI